LTYLVRDPQGLPPGGSDRRQHRPVRAPEVL